jgi:F/Y-rich N-terminus
MAFLHCGVHDIGVCTSALWHNYHGDACLLRQAQHSRQAARASPHERAATDSPSSDALQSPTPDSLAADGLPKLPKGLQLHSVGKIEYINPMFHTHEYIFPVGYHVRCRMLLASCLRGLFDLDCQQVSATRARHLSAAELAGCKCHYKLCVSLLQASRTLHSASGESALHDLEIHHTPSGPEFEVSKGGKFVATGASPAEVWRQVTPPAKHGANNAADARSLLRAFGLTSAAVLAQLLV